ncbi:EAL domain-containing protein [Halomonas sp. NyZ770]|uniref:putative bifunctional diguanylate cyclase/phosphodiesterase n=1 Tax=Halomonas sp. NyZ770 TaxID=2883106 RepID=UPI001D0A5149|nr:EAL domain-containing protein [Halomonas sp. NyZ770]UDM05993.1 EAL domain-containing protein [Halomonas sp. NyZ770]
MDVHNRELALQTGLLMLLATTVIIGGASLLFGVIPHLPQPQALAILPDSALVILLSGLGLSAVMANLAYWRRVTSVSLLLLCLYTLAHNLLAGTSGLSLLTGQPRLPSQALPTLTLAAFCLWVGPVGGWQRRMWQTGGILLWVIGIITLADQAGAALPHWLPRASALLPGLLCFSFGLAMIMVSRHIPHLTTSLSKTAVLAGLLGVSISMASWFLISWNQHQSVRTEAHHILESVTTSVERALTSRALVLKRLAERWQGVFIDASSRQREVVRYWNDYPSFLAMAYLDPSSRETWRRAQQGNDLLWLDEQLTKPTVLRWLNQQRATEQWLLPDAARPDIALLALMPSSEPRFQLVVMIDIDFLIGKETTIAEQAFALSISHDNGEMVNLRGLDSNPDHHEGTPLSEEILLLPEDTALHLSLWPRGSASFELGNFIAAGVGISGLLLTYQLVLSLALMAARAQRSVELTQAKEALEDQHRIQAMIARDEPYSATLLQICRLLEHQNPQWEVAIWRLEPSSARRIELLSASLPAALQSDPSLNESLMRLASELQLQQRSTVAWSLDEPSAEEFSRLLSEYGYRRASLHLLDGSYSHALGAVVLLSKHANVTSPDPGAQSSPSLLASALRLMRLAIERHNHQQTLLFHATHDALTGLGNRALFEDRLRHDVALAQRHQQQLAVLFIDLDDFKPINDTLGHAVGDKVLIHVAKRLEAMIRPSDTLCRLGGDEFVLLLPDLVNARDAEEVAERLLVELAKPYRIERHELYLSASIGVALSDETLEQPAALLQQADMAMYKAKQQGRNTQQTFTHDINHKLTQRVTLRNELQEAMAQEQFELHYQPLLTRDGKVHGFEALVRWNHPVKGAISPGLFIPIAEETGQIIGLSAWVMERAARDFCLLRPLLDGQPRVAINLSPLQFHRPSFLNTLRQTLTETGLPPGALELELTEGILMNDTEAAIETLNALRELGVSIAIDDFGTGFSSLSYLRHLPIDKIKIDRSFIMNIDHHRKDAAVVQGIIALAHHLDLTVVAEGIETDAQQQQLLLLGCDVLQGYLLARPMPFDTLKSWLAERQG